MSEKCRIKRIVPLSSKDIELEGGAINDICGLFSDSGISGICRYFDFIHLDGTEENGHSFRELRTSDRKTYAYIFDVDHTLFPVRIFYSDGSSECGFKYYIEKTVLTKPRLTSLYRKVGVLSPKTGRLSNDLDRSEFIPMWIERKLPFYAGNQKNKSHSGMDDSDWSAVCNAVHSKCISTNAIYSVPPVKKPGFDRKVPWNCEMSSGNGVWNAVMTSYNENECGFSTYSAKRVVKGQYGSADINEYVCDITGIKCYERIVEYSYLKSVYEDVEKEVKLYKVVPISNIMFISDENRKTVWDNMSSTLHGHL